MSRAERKMPKPLPRKRIKSGGGRRKRAVPEECAALWYNDGKKLTVRMPISKILELADDAEYNRDKNGDNALYINFWPEESRANLSPDFTAYEDDLGTDYAERYDI